jgi:hypothetical protein
MAMLGTVDEVITVKCAREPRWLSEFQRVTAYKLAGKAVNGDTWK